MSVAEIGALIVVSVPILIIVVCIFGGIISCVVESCNCKKYEKKYPKLFALIDLRCELQDKAIKWYNKNVASLKNEIQYRIGKQEYLCFMSRLKEEIELDKMKAELERLEKIDEKLMSFIDDLKVLIENTIKQDKKLLKFMKTRGWCRDD